MNNHKTICSICGEEASLVKESYQGYIEGHFHPIYFCKNCNTSFVPINEDVEAIYDLIYQYAEKVPGYNRYYRYHSAIKNEKDPLGYLASSEESYWVVKDALSKIEKEKSEIKIIEIGSGLGYLTYALNKMGYNAQGIDISRNSVEKATQQFGPYYVCADIHEYSKNIQKQYDVAILNEIIEHVEKPVEFLKSVLLMLKSGGKIVISTPNKTIFSESEIWHSDLPPVHLWWFSEKSMIHIGNLLDLKTTFTDFTNYYKNNDAYAILEPKQPEPIFNSKGVLINPQIEETVPVHPIKTLLKKNKISFYIIRKIKYHRFMYKCSKAGVILGVIFEKK